MKVIKNLQLKVEQFLKMKKPSNDTLTKIKEIINYCSNLYYDEDKESPLLDEEYDKLVNHYGKFAEKPKSVDTKSSKRNKNLVDTEHLFPEMVGTLFKTNYLTKEDKKKDKNEDANTVEEWFYKVLANNFIKPLKEYSVFISWKIDGNSITITYNDKREVIMALTRGRNGLGSDKTMYFKNKKLPSCISIKEGEMCCIKYEAVTTFDNKTKIEEIYGKEYASPCSLVSGILGRDDVSQEVIDLIDLVPIRIAYKEKKLTRLDELKLIYKIYEKEPNNYISIKPDINDGKIIMNKNGSSSFNFKLFKGNVAAITKYIEDTYNYFIENRDKLPHPVDGLVFEFVDDSVRKTMGRDDDENNFEFALKFPYSTKRSIVEDIEFYVSTNGTGRITPVVLFKKIKFSRAECDHVSIANYKRFKSLKLAKGDQVVISYRNDVLSYLTLPEGVEHVGKPIPFPTVCPKCGEKIKINKEKTFAFCVNKNCPSIKIGKLNNFLIKLGVDSVRENTIEDLYNAGLVKSFSSLYKLTAEQIEKIDGYKEKSAQNIIDAINSKKEIFDYELLGALGFKNIATSTCKEICKKFSLSDLKRITDDEFDSLSLQLLDVDGVASITANQFEKDFKKNLKAINNLEKYLTIKELKNSIKVTTEPKSIVVTGFRDPELQRKLEMAGHSIKSGVSKKTDMVITANKGSGTVKEKKALELGIPVYSVEEFHKKILETLI